MMNAKPFPKVFLSNFFSLKIEKLEKKKELAAATPPHILAIVRHHFIGQLQIVANALHQAVLHGYP